MIQATCEGCGRAWQVPDGGRSYACKDCGGRVSASGSDCPACGATNPPGGQYCVGCGASLSGDGTEAPRDREVEKRLAGSEFRRIKKTIFLLRALFVVQASLWGLILIAGVAIYTRNEEVLPLVVVAAVVTVLATLGAVRVSKEPFPWALVLACLQTLGVVLRIVGGEFDGSFVMSVVWAVVLWIAVTRAARLRHLMAEYDLKYAVKGTGRTARRAEARARTPRRELAVMAVVLVVVVPVSLFILISIASGPSVDDATEGFADAWNRGAWEEVAAMFPEGRRYRRLARIEDIIDRRGWHRDRPRLGEPSSSERRDRRAHVQWDTEHGGLSTTWELDDEEGWQLIGLDPPDVKIASSPTPQVEEFLAAWRSNDLARLAMQFSGDPEKRRARLERTFTRRGWLPTFPKIEHLETQRPGNGRARAYFEVEGDEMPVTYEFHRDHWRLTGLKFPRSR